MLQGQIQVKSRYLSFGDNLGKTCMSHLGQGNKFVPEFGFYIIYPNRIAQ